MFDNNLIRKFANKIFYVLAFMVLLSFSLFSFFACENDSSKDNTEVPSFDREEEDSTPMSNMDFTYETETLSYDEFPYVTYKWTRTLDKSAKSSSINSGVIDTTDEGWEALMNKFYDEDNDDFVYYTSKKLGADKNPTSDEDIKNFLDNNSVEYTDENFKDKFKEKLLTVFTNPKTHKDASDSKVFMLNNYPSKSSDEYGFGTAQVITNSSKVTLEKGKTAEITFWIMTQNISGVNLDGEFGANVRINNTISSNSQAPYQISNIDTRGEWKQYKLYIKADDFYETTFTLAFGLGYGEGSSDEGLYYVQGTAYFDDVSYRVLDEEKDKEILESIEGNTFGDSNLEYASEDPIDHNDKEFSPTNYYFYDLSMKKTLSNNLTEANVDLSDSAYTVAKDFSDITSNVLFENNAGQSKCELIGNEYKVYNLNYSAYTVKITSDNFVVDTGKYLVVFFKIKNKLSKFGSTNINIGIQDKFNTASEKRDLTTISEISDDYQNICLVIKNNFKDAEFDNREFDILIEIGPKNDEITANETDRTKFAKGGEVYISKPQIMSGEIEDTDADNYDIFEFFNSNSNKVQGLYAGYSDDYTKPSDTVYSLSAADGNLGQIMSYPTNLQNYQGIPSNHIYVKNSGNDLEKTINTRSGNGKNGNYAGLINTKYLDKYNENISLNIANELDGCYKNDEDIQPIMIYNKNSDHYGFIGSEISIASSSYAKINMKVRVTGDAAAYIYLVDISNADKKVLDFIDFESDGQNISGEQLKYQLKITKNSMNTDGWADVNFYIGTGKSEKNFRLEMWNGGRDGSENTASAGYVFFNNISVVSTSAFTEAERFADTFASTSNPLGLATKDSFTGENTKLYVYKYGETYNEQSYAWAQNETTIYSIYNKIDAVDTTEDEETEESSDEESDETGCASKTDPSTLWFSFSSILLAVALIVAIIALIVKKNWGKHKLRKRDSKSHYSVKSRTEVLKEIKQKKEKQTEIEEDDIKSDVSSEKTSNDNEPTSEQTLDSYVYGDVTDFSEVESNQENTETETDTDNETTEKDDDK